MSFEKGTTLRGTSLRALVEASSTSNGSYSPFKLKILLSSKRVPLVLLAVLTLAVALSSSFLSNVIAYEAFEVSWPGVVETLSRLSDDVIAQKVGRTFEVDLLGLTLYNPYEFNHDQKAQFADQVTGLWTEISFANSSGGLDAGQAYIGLNVTNASLAALDPSILRLSQVDAYRSTLECEAITPDNVGAMELGESTTEMSSGFNTSDGWYLYEGYYPGKLESLQTEGGSRFYFATYPLATAIHVYLGILTRYTWTNQTMNSTYGSVVPQFYNMSALGFTETMVLMQSWGLNCTFFKQQGNVDLVRTKEEQTWRRQNASFSETKTPVQMLIHDWQVALGYSAPGSANPGFAPALSGGNSIDLDTYAKNYLYAASETERMAYEAVASNKTRAQQITLNATTQRQFYRITYVPVILLSALVSLCVASLTVLILIWYSRCAAEEMRGRQVDALRLATDSIALHELDDLPESDWCVERLERWAELRVGYFVQDEKVRLRPV